MGLVAFVHDFIPHPISGDLREQVTTAFRIIGGFGLFLGMYSLLHMHITRIRRQQEGWGYSLFVFIGASLMIVFGLVNGGQGPVSPAPAETTTFKWLYNYIQVPCGATIFSILAFFIASAAYRSLRAKNIEALMLLIAAVVVMFGRVPISDVVSSKLFGSPFVFSASADFLLEYPNMAAKRAIMLGITLGGISQSLRILFGIERSYLGAGD